MFMCMLLKRKINIQIETKSGDSILAHVITTKTTNCRLGPTMTMETKTDPKRAKSVSANAVQRRPLPIPLRLPKNKRSLYCWSVVACHTRKCARLRCSSISNRLSTQRLDGVRATRSHESSEKKITIK